jgi:hypothetical protein
MSMKPYSAGRPADETEALNDLAARSKALGATLTAKSDRVGVAA